MSERVFSAGVSTVLILLAGLAIFDNDTEPARFILFTLAMSALTGWNRGGR